LAAIYQVITEDVDFESFAKEDNESKGLSTDRDSDWQTWLAFVMSRLIVGLCDIAWFCMSYLTSLYEGCHFLIMFTIIGYGAPFCYTKTYAHVYGAMRYYMTDQEALKVLIVSVYLVRGLGCLLMYYLGTTWYSYFIKARKIGHKINELRRLDKSLLMSDIAVMEYQDGRTALVRNSNQELLGYVPEKALANPQVRAIDKQPYLVEFVTNEGFHVGWGFRVDNTICTATHVARDSTYVLNPYNKERAYEIKSFKRKVSNDVCKLVGSTASFAMLGVKKCKVGKMRRNAALYIPEVTFFGNKTSTVAHSGAVLGEVQLPLPYAVKHSVSTKPGFSGAPMVSEGYVVGVHIGSLEGEANVGSVISPAYVKYDPESATGDEPVYGQADDEWNDLKEADAERQNAKAYRQFMSGRARNFDKKRKNVQPTRFEFDSDDDDEWFNDRTEMPPLWTNEGDQTPGHSQDFCRAPVVAGASQQSEATISQPTSRDLNELRRAWGMTNPCSSSAPVISVERSVRETQKSTQLVTECPLDSQKSPIMSTPQQQLIGEESSNPSPIVEEPKPNPAQAALSAEPVPKRRSKQAQIQTLKTLCNTLLQMGTGQRTFSEQQLNTISTLFKERRHQEALSILSEQPTQQC
jgi:hypothetical protein